MRVREFNADTANCGTVLLDAFPESEAIAKEVGWFLGMTDHDKHSLYSSIDIPAFAENAAFKHGLTPLPCTGTGAAWGVARVHGRNLFCFRRAGIWFGQTMRGVTRISDSHVLCAWSVK